MSKIKIKLRLQGFELDVEAERDSDITAITQGVSNQIANLIQPPGSVLNSKSTKREFIDVTPHEDALEERRGGRKRPASAARGSSGKSAPAIDFVNDHARFGTPSQSWNLVQKATWTIYVVGELKGITSLSAGVIGRTFSKHFRQAGEIRPSNISRDLGKAKTKTGDAPPLVGEDSTKSPSEWFLTEEGNRQTKELIARSVGQ